MRMKTAIAEEKWGTSITIHVMCPYCHTELVGVANYVIAMKCWQCKKPFKVENSEDVWDEKLEQVKQVKADDNLPKGQTMPRGKSAPDTLASRDTLEDKCSACNGKGSVKLFYTDGTPGGIDKCPSCNGTGKKHKTNLGEDDRFN